MKKVIVFLSLVLLIFVILILGYAEGTMPVDKKDKRYQIFVITPGEPLNQIIKRLSQQNLIRSRLFFFLVVKQLGIEKKIQAGDFRLSRSMNAFEIARTLTHGTLDIWITIIEGQRKEEIAQLIAKKFNIPEVEFLKYAKEGYLFPDTYLIPKNANIETILKILEENFNRKMTQINLKEAGKKLNLKPEEVIIIASLIEREAKFNHDRPLVASVILNRLRNKMKLDIDATVQYALGYQVKEKTWWKKNLTYEDLKIDSPYNTYLYQGLPPGPISNPGLNSIKAVLDAPKTEFFYYISDKKGNLHFAKTYDQHLKNIEKYLR